jgi:S1/P1 Nuclease
VRCLRWILWGALSTSSWAWNAQGHRIVVKLANSYLSPSARIYLNHIQDTHQFGGASTSISDAAIWMDKYYSPKYRFLRKLHYIQIPEGDTRYFPRYTEKYHALFAIEYAKLVLKSKHSNALQKAFAMRLLLHVVADIHQPLHTINWYSARYPQGDRGGNLVRIKKQHIARNLHSFWDRGGGWLMGSVADDEQKIKSLTYRPCSGNEKDWVQWSHRLAVQKAYHYPHAKSQWGTYIHETQEVTKSQIQSAACHLANIIEELAKSQMHPKLLV